MRYKHFIFCAFASFVSLILLGSSVASDSFSNAVTSRGDVWWDLDGDGIKDSPSRDLSVSADFDGDGTEDRAYFTRTSKGFNLIVSSGENKFILMTLDSIYNYGISKAPPGLYVRDKRWRASIYKPCSYISIETCDKNQPDSFEVKYASINFFRYESASRVYYWDRDSFRVVHTSD